MAITYKELGSMGGLEWFESPQSGSIISGNNTLEMFIPRGLPEFKRNSKMLFLVQTKVESRGTAGTAKATVNGRGYSFSNSDVSVGGGKMFTDVMGIPSYIPEAEIPAALTSINNSLLNPESAGPAVKFTPGWANVSYKVKMWVAMSEDIPWLEFL